MFEESTKLIDILTFIGSLICICAICHISRTDPFENHIIKNLTDYFNVLPNNINYTELNNTENISINDDFDVFDEVEKISGSSSLCNKIKNNFEKNKGKILSSVFDIKFNTIHRLSIELIVVILFSKFGILIVFVIFWFIWSNDVIAVVRCTFCFLLYSLLANLVLLIIIAVTYNKSDIGDYNDFLDCSNIKENSFEIFSDVTK